MAETKNLCAQVPLPLHQKVTDAKEAAGMTTSEYMTQLITEYFDMKENGGKMTMTNDMPTLAVKITDELNTRLKAHLRRESDRLGRRYTQQEFIIGLIEQALNAAESEAADRQSAGA